jgi:hypothetical protein
MESMSKDSEDVISFNGSAVHINLLVVGDPSREGPTRLPTPPGVQYCKNSGSVITLVMNKCTFAVLNITLRVVRALRVWACWTFLLRHQRPVWGPDSPLSWIVGQTAQP